MMTDEDKNLIVTFVGNAPMYEAVRRVLLSGMIGEDFAARNWVYRIDKKQSDEAYGNEVKTTAKALEWIESAFADLKKVTPTNPQATQVNEAR
jgi:hypothetical protein